MKTLAHILLIACSLLLPLVHAQDYPTKPIRYVVGFASGTATDLVARLIAQRLRDRWSQQVIVDKAARVRCRPLQLFPGARNTPDTLVQHRSRTHANLRMTLTERLA